jgi:hypothetical protein
MPKKLKTEKLYTVVMHGIFGEGIMSSQRVSESGSHVTECLFSNGDSYRLVLTDSLLVCSSLTRRATKPESKALRRRALHASLNADKLWERATQPIEEHVQIADGEQPELEPEQELYVSGSA